jgi:hypothetical protein
MIRTTDIQNTSTVAGLDMKAKEVGVKFSSEDWKSAEKKLSTFDLKVKDELCDLANNSVGIVGTNKVDELSFKTVGTDFYKLIRQELVKISLVKDKIEQHTKKMKEKPLKTADKIRQQNTLRIIQDELVKILKGFDQTSYRIPAALTNKILEIRGIGFLQSAQFLIKNCRTYLDASGNIKKSKIHFVYSIIIAMQKFFSSIIDMEGNSLLNSSQRLKIADTFVEDFEASLTELKKTYKFDAMVAYTNDPQLLFYTDYDSYIPNKGFKPYHHQIDVVNYVKKSILENKPMVVSYKAMTGNGKTVSVVAVAKLIMNLKMMYKTHDNIELIFCCNLRSVKEQAAQWLFNSDIPFAMGTIDGDRGLRIINNYNCKSDDKRVAIVCSPEACYEILNMDSSKKYILFLDEPTIGADMKSSAAKMNVRIMSNLPQTTVLSSATLPHDIYPWIKDSHTSKYGSSEFVTVYSNKIHIGCEIKTFDGELVVPHLNSKTSAELKTAIERISEIPFLGRAYTTNVANSIYELMQKENIQNLPDIPSMFTKIENLNTDSVRNLCMELLSILSGHPDDVIQRVCSTKIQKNIVQTINDATEEVVEEEQDFEWETEPVIEIDNKVNFDKFGTTDAHKFMRQNLVATINPVDFALTNFKELIDKTVEEIGSMRKLTQVVSQKTALWQKSVDRLENQKFDNELQRMRETDELLQSKPQFQFPAKFQINCPEHIKTFAKKTRLAIDRNAIRHELCENDIPMNDIVVQEELMILLWCGVGVYTPSANLNHTYLSIVLRLAEEGKLAYLISDASISYGTNYPINRVFISSDFNQKYSINTIFQLMSRAGRVGKSWIAEAFIDNDCALRIIGSTRTTEIDIETKNINELYQDIVLENIARDEKLIAELEAKKKAEEERLKQEEEERIRKDNEERQKVDSQMNRLRALRELRERERKQAQSPQSPQTTQTVESPQTTQTVESTQREYRPREQQSREYRPREQQSREYRPREQQSREYRPREQQSREYRPREQQSREYRPREQQSREYRPREQQERPPRVTTVENVMAMPPARISIQNDFRRESTGNVTRRNNTSRLDRLEQLKK